MRSFETKHAGSMALVPMDRWLNSDQFKKKESSKRMKIDRFGAFSVPTCFSCETRYTGRDHCVEAAHCRPGEGVDMGGALSRLICRAGAARLKFLTSCETLVTSPM